MGATQQRRTLASRDASSANPGSLCQSETLPVVRIKSFNLKVSVGASAGATVNGAGISGSTNLGTIFNGNTGTLQSPYYPTSKQMDSWLKMADP